VGCGRGHYVGESFDTLDHTHLRELLRRRVRDGVLLRLIGKWLNAGVLEEGVVTTPEAGSPQGGVISPLLANVYLHYVLDVWFEQEVKPRLRGSGFLVRYADDCAPRRRKGRLQERPGRHAAGEMRVGPSESGCRTRFRVVHSVYRLAANP
jgi:hypothetical protein